MNTTAGYSETPLNKKLGFKEGHRFALINAPEGLSEELEPLPPKIKNVKPGSRELDLVLLFCKTMKSMELQLPKAAKSIKPNGMVWVAWPKKSSGFASDLSFNVVQKTGLKLGLVDVKICAINEVWSGLKFMYRVRDRAMLRSQS
ncbi:MAG TPA: hypothetical protein VJ023_03920 [Pyrinomonadaceae bacterium]|nr:hypothetical protein [Pyrinomonadaceae bacterium]